MLKWSFAFQEDLLRHWLWVSLGLGLQPPSSHWLCREKLEEPAVDHISSSYHFDLCLLLHAWESKMADIPRKSGRSQSYPPKGCQDQRKRLAGRKLQSSIRWTKREWWRVHTKHFGPVPDTQLIEKYPHPILQLVHCLICILRAHFQFRNFVSW